jgi:hypothetical protein
VVTPSNGPQNGSPAGSGGGAGGANALRTLLMVLGSLFTAGLGGWLFQQWLRRRG